MRVIAQIRGLRLEIESPQNFFLLVSPNSACYLGLVYDKVDLLAWGKLWRLRMSRPCLFPDLDGKWSAGVGCNIDDVLREASRIVRDKDGHLFSPIVFDFNGVSVSIDAESVVNHAYRDWSRAMNGYIPKSIGPVYKEQLSSEDLANDAKIEAENEQRRKQHREEYEANMARKKYGLKLRLLNAGPIELSDADGWQKTKEANPDGYGHAIVRYAETWARLMQVDLKNGKTIAENADSTSHECDIEGITGFMYGAAVSILAHCWVHGEELRVWHNLDSQIGNEGEKANQSGGVLNPALVTIGG